MSLRVSPLFDGWGWGIDIYISCHFFQDFRCRIAGIEPILAYVWLRDSSGDGLEVGGSPGPEVEGTCQCSDFLHLIFVGAEVYKLANKPSPLKFDVLVLVCLLRRIKLLPVKIRHMSHFACEVSFAVCTSSKAM